MDGDRGLVFPQCPAPVIRFYGRERTAAHRRQAALTQFACAPAITTDRKSIEIGANISSAAEAIAAFAGGADGVGLFRTELLFARRNTAPSEDEQFAVYAAAVRAANGRPVILRTADVGGDKPLPFLKLPGRAQSVSRISRRTHLSGIPRVDRRAISRGVAGFGGRRRSG